IPVKTRVVCIVQEFFTTKSRRKVVGHAKRPIGRAEKIGGFQRNMLVREKTENLTNAFKTAVSRRQVEISSECG
ncbi:MAG TPA: hypothetical protein VEZ13_21105, partial [Brevibacillus sp.]|nr:hypothetical protein [Brevibacillus sp.]